MEKKPAAPPAADMTRRRFVALVAAGSAAFLAKPVDALAAAARRKRPAPHAGAKHAAKPAVSASQKEFERQRAGTLETLKTIRAHKLAAGSELAFVFTPRAPKRKDAR